MIRPAYATALLAMAGCLAMPLPLEAVTGTTFQVSANIVPGCLIIGGGSNYGTLAYGTYAALSTSTLVTSLFNRVQLQCTPGVRLNMSIDGGQNNAEGRHLKLDSGTAQLAYKLYSDNSLSQEIGGGQSVYVAYSNPDDIRLTIYGRVRLPGNLPAGQYRDVVQVQLSW